MEGNYVQFQPLLHHPIFFPILLSITLISSNVLCHIDALESVDLSNNHLSSIPSGFITGSGNLSGLRGLEFSRNRLSCFLPNFDGFLKLEFSDLSHNTLSGMISSHMDGLVILKILSLGYNEFTGFVPTHLGKSMVLGQLGLPCN
ncbi:hypothetical protein RHGRI_010448 [Rhododendron griersonianum]|uniref:Uncharacterized protein n=1 Tax=Rhododendron griersonianum TaxID=479676 RepID=A0AAV6KIP7_9ERIC|nr:hypothetical protein RHGRI_010448 [Rhododendron griersonianum]